MKFIAFLVASCVAFNAYASEGDTGKMKKLMSPDEVENQILLDEQTNPLYESTLLAPIKKWKKDVAEKTGFHWEMDYIAAFLSSNSDIGEDNASSGMVRFFGYWDLVNRGGLNKGSLNWKFGNRHKYSDVPPSDLGFENGYAGLLNPPFSNQGNRLTTLYWRQNFADDKGAFVAGLIDVTDFVDVYLLASPWTGFGNYVFSTGSATIDLPNEAAIGMATGGIFADKFYIHAGIADANSDPTDPLEGFNTAFNDADFFKWVEIGLTSKQKSIYFDNTHLTFWHIDERVNGTPDGWGVNFSWQTWIDEKWLPFVRAGYTEDSGSLLEKSISVGVGYQPVPRRGAIGFAFNWGVPNEASFGDVDEQYTTELFWRYQLTKEVAVTPSVQYIRDPALNQDEDNLWVMGLRLRVVL